MHWRHLDGSGGGFGIGPGHQVVDARCRPAVDELGQRVGEPGVRVHAVELAGLDQRCDGGPVLRALVAAGEERIFPARAQSRGHSAHIGQDVVVHYRWHPLYGRHVRCILMERRASGEIAHVELEPGVVTMVAAWKLDPVQLRRPQGRRPAGLAGGTE